VHKGPTSGWSRLGLWLRVFVGILIGHESSKIVLDMPIGQVGQAAQPLSVEAVEKVSEAW